MLDNTIVITYSNTQIHREYQKEFHKLYHRSFARHIDFTEEDIKASSFWSENPQMFQYKKYGGYFLWKSFIIMKTLELYPENSVLYCDSNLRFTHWKAFENSFSSQISSQGTFFVRHENFINRHWTKRDCFILMDADSDRYHNANQVWTPLMGFDNSKRTKELIQDYMHYCRNPQIVSEEPNLNGENLDGFVEHRWEQSVMSILVEKYGYRGIPDTQLMNWVTKHYSPELMKMKEEINANPLAKSV